MKKPLKKALSVLLSAFMLSGAMAGCSQDTTSNSSNDSETSGTAASDVEQITDEPITITLLTWHGPDSATNYYQGYQEIAEDYMALQKNVTVEIRYEADDTYGSILETGFAGGTAPDIIQMKSGQRSTYKMNLMNLREELLKPSAYDTRNETWAENFVGGLDAFPVEEGAEDSNSILFVPNDGNPEVYTGKIYLYNKKLVADAGLDPEDTPETWTEMFEWLEAIAAKGETAPIAGSNDVGGKVSQLGYCFGSDYTNEFFDSELNDPEFLDDLYWDKLYVLTCYDQNGDASQMALDDVPYYPAMFKLMKQHLSYYQSSWTENSAETETLTFASGKAAMITTAFWDYDTLVSSLSESVFPDGYGFFRIPYLGEDTLDYAVDKGWISQSEADAAAPYAVTKPSFSGGSGTHDSGFCVNLAVGEDETRKAVVMDFLQYLSSKEAQEKYVVTASSISPVKDVPVIDAMENFIVEEPEGGYAERIVGYTVVEWGAAGWDVEMLKFLNGEMDYDTLVKTVSAPEYKGDIPSQEALEEAVQTAQAELDAAGDDEKEEKQRALTYATLRQKLYNEYYYEMTGALEPLAQEN